MTGTAQRATLVELLPRPAWFDDAACAGEGPELWFGPDGYESSFHRDKREARALAVCTACPVRYECRTHGRREREQGIWGGETEIERARRGCASPNSTIQNRLSRERRANGGS